jgi:hypothetical protein
MGLPPSIALVTTETRLAGLRAKFGTEGAARFRWKAGRSHYRLANAQATFDEEADFDRFVEEDTQYRAVLKSIRSELDGLGYPVVPVPRSYLANYFFGMTQAVVVVGPDGLVANVAKYVGDLPIIGINPLPDRIDGVLVRYQVGDARRIVHRTLENNARCQSVTMAQVHLNDGQSMLAFNDFFVGRQTHVSARYVIYVDQKSESQSSSGVIVSTGAGATGWLSSVYNMAKGVGKYLGRELPVTPDLKWDTQELLWVVREPFRSRVSQIDLVIGKISKTRPLRLESLMPEGGVIFSDGIESDFLAFNSGTIAQFSISPKPCKLVVEA